MMARQVPPPPLVSVVMAVYDGAAFVAEAIASVLAQTHRHLELIVVDDGSTDDTVAVVRSHAARDPRIRLLCRLHQGHAGALNAGIAAAQGSFIARIDHDDLWHPQRLELQLNWMERHGIDICGAWARRFGAATGTIRFARGHEAIRYETLFTCPILDSATLFRGAVLRDNPYPPDAIVRQELVQCVRLLPHYRFANLPRVLCDYRFHDRQKTRRFRPLIAYRHAQLCQQHFAQMFPDATAAEQAAFNAITRTGSAPLDRPGIEAAARLFADRLCPPDREARLRMRRRWRYLWARGIRNEDRDIEVYQRVFRAFGQRA
ncbi:hypothetical protein AUP44_17935 [Tistrella mobilis]|uniref:Glycosyltransferase 2-like domain-containing protein n=1 Tax=Tistrella mobilis TaxID=171437 RepID=A0A162JIV5_9PROT|nr:hypothetical protein AUP44_17935 [Tistrella mobilis]